MKLTTETQRAQRWNLENSSRFDLCVLCASVVNLEEAK